MTRAWNTWATSDDIHAAVPQPDAAKLFQAPRMFPENRFVASLKAKPNVCGTGGISSEGKPRCHMASAVAFVIAAGAAIAPPCPAPASPVECDRAAKKGGSARSARPELSITGRTCHLLVFGRISKEVLRSARRHMGQSCVYKHTRREDFVSGRLARLRLRLIPRADFYAKSVDTG